MRSIVVIAHDMRSTHNVGALLRTAECLGVQKVVLTGYTPYPTQANDVRLPHIHEKLTKQIQKTALGATDSIEWSYSEQVEQILEELKQAGYTLFALEQAAESILLPDWQPPQKVALLLGREVEGIELSLLQKVDSVIEIPQFGKKESLNVVQAAAIAMAFARFAA